MFPGFLIAALQWSVVATSVAAVWFIIQYTLTSPWWHDQLGRTVVAMDTATLVLMVPNVIRFFWRGVISSLALGYTDVIAILMTFTIIVVRCVVWFRIEKPHAPRTQLRKYLAIRRAQQQRADKEL